jgi:hypothetical protein
MKLMPLSEAIEGFKEMTSLADTTISVQQNTDENYEQLDLKVERDEIITKEVFFNTSTSRKPRRIGNMWAFQYDKDGEPRIVIGPHCI